MSYSGHHGVGASSSQNIANDMNQEKVVKKTVGFYQCKNENCSHSWTSVHAWDDTDSVTYICPRCTGVAKNLTVEEGTWELTDTICVKCHTGGSMVQQDQNSSKVVCHNCDAGMVILHDHHTQQRSGKLGLFGCLESDCGVSWKGFVTEESEPLGQKCKFCKCQGAFIKTEEVTWRQRQNTLDDMDSSGEHLVELCGMCQRFRKNGSRWTCHGKLQVRVEPEPRHVSSVSAEPKVPTKKTDWIFNTY